MTAAAVLGIVGTIVTFIVWLVKRKLDAEDAKTPADREQERVNKVYAELVCRDSLSASARVNEWLRRIRAKDGGGNP